MPTIENRVLSLNMQAICEVCGLETWLKPTEEVHLLVLELSPICPEYMLEARLTPKERNSCVVARLTAYLCKKWFQNLMRHQYGKWESVYSVNCKFKYKYRCAVNDWKHVLYQPKKIVFYRLTYSLSVMNWSFKHETHQAKSFIYWCLKYRFFFPDDMLEARLALEEEICLLTAD
jgi:hypothetical protein